LLEVQHLIEIRSAGRDLNVDDIERVHRISIQVEIAVYSL
jgi:hypothetical protein